MLAKRGKQQLTRFIYGRSDAGCAAYLSELLSNRSRRVRGVQLSAGLSELHLLQAEGGRVGNRTCGALLAVCSRWRSLSAARDVFAFMSHNDITPDTTCYTFLVRSCPTLPEVQGIVTDLKQRAPGDPQVARLFQPPHSAEVKLHVASLFLKEGAKPDARALLESIPQCDRTPLAWQLLFEAQPCLAEAEEMFDTLSATRSLPSPTPPEVFNALMLHCATEGKPGAAESVLLLMRGEGETPGVLAFRRLMLSHLNAADTSASARLESVSHSLQRKVNSGLPANALDISVLLRACAAAALEPHLRRRALAVAEGGFQLCELLEDEKEPAVYTGMFEVYAALARGVEEEEEEGENGVGGAARLQLRGELLARLMAQRRMQVAAPSEAAMQGLAGALGLPGDHFVKEYSGARTAAAVPLGRPLGDAGLSKISDVL